MKMMMMKMMKMMMNKQNTDDGNESNDDDDGNGYHNPPRQSDSLPHPFHRERYSVPSSQPYLHLRLSRNSTWERWSLSTICLAFSLLR
jgi:hypothetical protein